MFPDRFYVLLLGLNFACMLRPVPEAVLRVLLLSRPKPQQRISPLVALAVVILLTGVPVQAWSRSLARVPFYMCNLLTSFPKGILEFFKWKVLSVGSPATEAEDDARKQLL